MDILKYSLLSFTTFFDLEEIIFENFNFSENNIVSVKLAKVLTYYRVLLNRSIKLVLLLVLEEMTIWGLPFLLEKGVHEKNTLN
jgi:hypothetical protein